MRRRSIGTIVLLAVLSVIGVLPTPVLWLDQLLSVKCEQEQRVAFRLAGREHAPPQPQAEHPAPGSGGEGGDF